MKLTTRFFLFLFLLFSQLDVASAGAETQSFLFFGKRVYLDCSKADPEDWRIRFHSNGNIREVWLRLGSLHTCKSKNYEYERRVGGVYFKVRNPSSVSFDANGRVNQIYAANTYYQAPVVKIDSRLGMLQKTGHEGSFAGLGLEFFPGGELRSVRGATHGSNPIWYAPPGMSKLGKVQKIYFTEAGGIDRVVPCISNDNVYCQIK